MNNQDSNTATILGVNKIYTRDEILNICENMKRYGGGFISSLSESILKADMTNLQKLQRTFAEEFSKYHNINA